MIRGLAEKVIAGGRISRGEASALAEAEGAGLFELFAGASRIRERFRQDRVELCSIVNAKSGACPEDCSYCAQSAHSATDAPIFPLLSEGAVLDKAREARDAGVKRFCIVTSGRSVDRAELRAIAAMVGKVRRAGLLPCATLGLLDREGLEILMESGLERYHHNLETSERFFPEICTTHTYRDKISTIMAVRELGLSLCCGGIFGLGEEWHDRIDLAFSLLEANPDSVPINFLIAVQGTPLGGRDLLPPLEALKIVSLYRFILPDKEIRVCGGRRQVLGDFNSFVFMAGADALLTGNYLTTTGVTYEDDLRLVRQFGLTVDGQNHP